MKGISIRLTQVIINNFKNVSHGIIDLDNNRKSFKSSILGLYGQNGSGKTALIDAIQLLKINLMGQPVPHVFGEYVSIGTQSSHFSFSFDAKKEEESYQLKYEFCIRKVLDHSVQNLDQSGNNPLAQEKTRVEVYDEIFSCSYAGNGKRDKIAPIISTETYDVFSPNSKYLLLVGKEKSIKTDLLVIKKLAQSTSRSFIFSSELLNTIRSNKNAENPVDYSIYSSLIDALVNYGNFELFVINTQNSGLISLNAQPFTFKYEMGNSNAIGSIMLPLDKPITVPKEEVDVIKKIMKSMNVVLIQIIPGLTVHIKELGNQLLPNGNIGERIQLMSDKNGISIPLCYESEGIKKIISILQLLTVMFNQQSITVAIDELDSGIFEYLLGELLRIISEKGKGQLIFTSHNLRPLETIDKGFIAFTTTNPNNRYIRLVNVKETNNLRDFYYRDIVLGEQNEELYDSTHNAEIALSFKEAGEFHAP